MVWEICQIIEWIQFFYSCNQHFQYAGLNLWSFSRKSFLAENNGILSSLLALNLFTETIYEWAEDWSISVGMTFQPAFSLSRGSRCTKLHSILTFDIELQNFKVSFNTHYFSTNNVIITLPSRLPSTSARVRFGKSWIRASIHDLVI